MPPHVKDKHYKKKSHVKPVPFSVGAMPGLPGVTAKRSEVTPHPAILNPRLSDPLHPQLAALNTPVPTPTDPGGFLTPSIPDILGIPGPDAGDLIPDSIPGSIPGSDTVNSVLDGVNLLTDPARLVKIVGGGVLILMGLWQLSKMLTGADPVRHAQKAAGEAAKIAAIIPK